MYRSAVASSPGSFYTESWLFVVGPGPPIPNAGIAHLEEGVVPANWLLLLRRTKDFFEGLDEWSTAPFWMRRELKQLARHGMSPGQAWAGDDVLEQEFARACAGVMNVQTSRYIPPYLTSGIRVRMES